MLRLILFLFASMVLFSCVDPCEEIDCGSNGTCEDKFGNCICDLGYEGVNCASKSFTKFLGTWNSVEKICQVDTMRNDSNMLVLVFDTVMIDHVWTITGDLNPLIFNYGNLFLEVNNINSNQVIGSSLVSPSQAKLNDFEIGGTSASGRLNYVDSTKMIVDFSSTIYLDGNTCRYTLTK